MNLGEPHPCACQDVVTWDRLASAGWNYSSDQYWFHRELLYPAIDDALERAEPQTVLDFGCGVGQFTAHLRGRGYECEAYDPAAAMAARAREETGAVVFSSPEQIPRAAYDSVIANTVLSAVRDPQLALRTIRELLIDGGQLIVSVPHPVFALLDEIHTTTERSWFPEGEDGQEGLLRYLSRPRQEVGWGGGLPSTTLYHRTLGDYSAALANCGFMIASVTEPVPSETAAGSNPALYQIFSTVPGFLVVDARLGMAPR